MQDFVCVRAIRIIHDHDVSSTPTHTIPYRKSIYFISNIPSLVFYPPFETPRQPFPYDESMCNERKYSFKWRTQ